MKAFPMNFTVLLAAFSFSSLGQESISLGASLAAWTRSSLCLIKSFSGGNCTIRTILHFSASQVILLLQPQSWQWMETASTLPRPIFWPAGDIHTVWIPQWPLWQGGLITARWLGYSHFIHHLWSGHLEFEYCWITSSTLLSLLYLSELHRKYVSSITTAC